MDGSDRQELTPAALSALIWSYGSTVIKIVSQMFIGIVLARLLGPEPFGLVAVAWIVISLGSLIADLGFGAAVVQSKEVSEHEVRYVFTIQVLVGTGLTLAIAGSASLIAHIFKQPQLVPVIRSLSLIFVIQSFGQTATSLLKRNLDFRNLRISEVLSYLIAFIMLGIPLAYLGFGVWSLVIAQLSQNLLFSILAYSRVQHSIKPNLSISTNLFGFGSKAMGTNILNWTIDNMDNAFVGRSFGVISLGLYNRAFSLMTAPMSNVVSVLQGVLFPAYSRIQDETGKLKQVYLASVGAISALILPIYISVAVIPHTIIEGLYGHRWLGSIPLLVPLALAVPFHAVMALAGPLVWGKGKVGRELVIQFIAAFLFLLMLIITSRISVVTLAWGVFMVAVVRSALMTRLALSMVKANLRDFLRSIRGAAILGILASGLTWGVEKSFLMLSVPVTLRMALDVLTVTVGVAGIILLFPSLLLTVEVVWLLGRFDRLPVAVRSFIRIRGLGVG